MLQAEHIYLTLNDLIKENDEKENDLLVMLKDTVKAGYLSQYHDYRNDPKFSDR